jgi:hypothetical protein
MTTNYNADRTRNGVNGWSRQFSDTVYSALLAANTNSTIAVPLTAAMGAPTATQFNKFYALINCTPATTAATDTFVALNTAAVKPIAPAVGIVLNAVSSVLIPEDGLCFLVKSGDVLNFISGGTPNVIVQFYAVQE